MAEETAFASPITLTLYGSDDSIFRELHRNIIPWGLLKQAIRMSKTMIRGKESSLSEENIDQLSDFVLMVFKDQCTREELENGANVSELLAVLKSIMTRGTQVINPTLPPIPKAGRRRK